MATWLATARSDPMSLVVGLAALACLAAGYGAVSGVTRHTSRARPTTRAPLPATPAIVTVDQKSEAD
jgi:hypothetical protein